MTRARPALEIVTFCALVLGAGAFVVAVRGRTGWDQDIWWHLATGRWIVEHGQVPATDPFSQFGHGKPWVAYSWLFEFVTYAAYTLAGLRGIVLLCGALGATIAAALYTLVRRCGASPFRAVPLTVVAFYAMMPLTTPRPWLFSLLFFLIELHVIVTARNGRYQALWALPFVFVLWANMHIQFALGLAVLGAGAVEAVWVKAQRETVARWIAVGTACGLATLANPYHFGLYSVVREYIGQTLPWMQIGEFLAPSFRSTPDWVVLALVLTAAGCFGWQLRDRATDVFWLLLFMFGVWLGFRSQRDVWVIATTAACIIASTRPRATPTDQDLGDGSRWVATIVATSTAALLLVFAALPLAEERIEAHVARSYPVAAAAFLENRGVTGPLYNYYDWGGYLMWRVPRLPVAMDGRTTVHDEARIFRHVDTWQGKPAWRTDPELSAANIVVGPRDLPLASLLRLDDRFTLVYEDRDGPAVVFEKKRPATTTH